MISWGLAPESKVSLTFEKPINIIHEKNRQISAIIKNKEKALNQQPL